MFVPGSHKWDDVRVPRLDEVCFAGERYSLSNTLLLVLTLQYPEMDPGSGLIFLASCYHGGGSNIIRDEVRKIHALFFVRGTLRTEENQFLAIPRSRVLTMGTNMLSLLGYKKPSTVLGIVENQDPALNLQAVFNMESKPSEQRKDSGFESDLSDQRKGTNGWQGIRTWVMGNWREQNKGHM
jgi:ectoine hydroxylase-related dioxygenase (phytanoyl-CoA dioxygenase family)